MTTVAVSGLTSFFRFGYCISTELFYRHGYCTNGIWDTIACFRWNSFHGSVKRSLRRHGTVRLFVNENPNFFYWFFYCLPSSIFLVVLYESGNVTWIDCVKHFWRISDVDHGIQVVLCNRILVCSWETNLPTDECGFLYRWRLEMKCLIACNTIIEEPIIV